MKRFLHKQNEIFAIQFEGGIANAQEIINWAAEHNVKIQHREASEPWVSDDGREGHDGWTETLQLIKNHMEEVEIGEWVVLYDTGDIYKLRDDDIKLIYDEAP